MEKINIAEILKDCPKGMELDCTLFEGLEFDGIVDNEWLPIRCRIKNPNGGYNVYNFTKCGCWLNTTFAKCVIFPKGKTTWEGFQRPFKDGDILTDTKGNICIYKGPIYYDKQLVDFYCGYRIIDETFVLKLSKSKHFGFISQYHLSNEDEKQKLFDAIKANSYNWNPETKILEKLIIPKFKIGDRVKKKGDIRLISIKDVRDNYYIITIPDYFDNCYITDKLSFNDQDDYELVPNKFDITTLKEFDKVLVRCNSLEKWHIQFFEKYNTESSAKYPFICLCNSKYCQCIPYEGNEHLLNKTDDCDNYYKNWE